MPATISESSFGTLPDGRQARLFTLTNPNGLIIKITDFGGIITEIHAPDRNGKFADIVLGFDNVTPYVKDSPYFGALIGRYGNRIGGGRFSIDGRQVQLAVNDGEQHLHGGPGGFHQVLWQAEPFLEGDSVGLTLTYRSPDGDQGYPGNLDASVRYAFTNDNQLIMTFEAVSDAATPVNLTQHSYFNLRGNGHILDHELRIDADGFTPIGSTRIPLGHTQPVAGSPFDFRAARPIGTRILDDDEQLRNGSGYDHNFVLNRSADGIKKNAAVAYDPSSGRILHLHTEEPGVQFYSGNFLDGSLQGKGMRYAHRSGFCLEPQHFPDSPNQPAFPNTILRPGEQYRTVSIYEFGVMT